MQHSSDKLARVDHVTGSRGFPCLVAVYMPGTAFPVQHETRELHRELILYYHTPPSTIYTSQHVMAFSLAHDHRVHHHPSKKQVKNMLSDFQSSSHDLTSVLSQANLVRSKTLFQFVICSCCGGRSPIAVRYIIIIIIISHSTGYLELFTNKHTSSLPLLLYQQFYWFKLVTLCR